MAETGLVLNPGVGGGTVLTDSLGGGTLAPVSKILLGAAGADSGFVSQANPMPVSGTVVVSNSTGTTAVSGTVPVTVQSGTLTALQGTSLVQVAVALPAGAAKIGWVDTDADAATGALAPGTAFLVAGQDVGGTARAILTNTLGHLQLGTVLANLLGITTVGFATPQNVVENAGTLAAITGTVNVFHVNNGTVSISAVTPGTAAASLGKAEDNPHASGDVGVMMLGVRQDFNTAYGADGDYTPISTNQYGWAKVSIQEVNVVSVPVLGTVTVQGTANVNVTGGTLAAINGTVPVSVTGTANVNVTNTVTVDSELPAALALAENLANPTVPGVGSYGMLYDGSTWDRAKGDSTDGALVNLGANNDVTVTSGTITAVQGTVNVQVVGGTVVITPSGTQNTKEQSGTVMAGNTDIYNVAGSTLTVTRFGTQIAAAAAATTDVVAAIASTKLRLLSLSIINDPANGTVRTNFCDGNLNLTIGGLSGTQAWAPGAGEVLAFNPIGHYETTSGSAFRLYQAAAGTFNVHGIYARVP